MRNVSFRIIARGAQPAEFPRDGQSGARAVSREQAHKQRPAQHSTAQHPVWQVAEDTYLQVLVLSKDAAREGDDKRSRERG